MLFQSKSEQTANLPGVGRGDCVGKRLGSFMLLGLQPEGHQKGLMWGMPEHTWASRDHIRESGGRTGGEREGAKS